MKVKPLPPPINLMVGTCGHIDHGKTELVKMFTGCDTDTLKEEKDRGMSINLGFAPCPVARGKRIGLVDVPGHEDFIRNMVAGATGIDIVMLVVAADDGIMPQTVEHFNIADLLGVKKGIVVITKTDLVTEDRIEEVKAELGGFVKGTFLEKAPIVPFSSITGQGVGDLRKLLDETVDNTERRTTEGVFRLPVERSFSAEGFGTIMTGIATRGKISVRDQVEILPIGKKGIVRKLQVFAQDWNEGYAGQCMAVNVGGVEKKDVDRGAVLATAGYFKPNDIVLVRLRILADAPARFKNRTPIRFHAGTTEALGVAILLEKDYLEPGENGLVLIQLEQSLIVEPGDSYIVRLQNPVLTVGGGRIIGHSEHRLKRKRSWVVEEVLNQEASLASMSGRAAFAIKSAGRDGLERKDLALRATLTMDQTEEMVTELTERGEAVTLPGGRLIVHREHFDSYLKELEKSLDTHHKADPLRVGFTAVELRKDTRVRSELVTAALERLVRDGVVVMERDRYRLASFKIELDPEQARLTAEIERVFLEGKFKTPRPDELGGLIQGKEADIRKMLDKLVESGVLVRTDPRIFFHRDNVEEVRRKLVAYIEEHGELDSFNFKTLINSSRKYAIPLLDHFDAIGVTMRGHQNKRYLKK